MEGTQCQAQEGIACACCIVTSIAGNVKCLPDESPTVEIAGHAFFCRCAAHTLTHSGSQSDFERQFEQDKY